MSSSPSITLFTEQIDPSRRPLTLFASAVVHTAVLALLSFGILTAPQIDTHAAADRFTMRHLDLHTPEQQERRAALGIRYPGPQATPQREQTAALRQAIHARKGPQTLLQPDLPKPLTLLHELPVPRVMIWTPSKTPVKTIVAPTPAPPTMANVHPSLDAPNSEINLADVDIAAAPVPAPKLALMPSSTSPVAVQGTSVAQLPPATVTQSAATPTPAAILSASDLQMKDGSVTLPPINETASDSDPGELRPGAPHASAAGSAQSAAGQGTAKAVKPAPQGNPGGAAAGLAQGGSTGAEQGDPNAAHITLPRNGQFSAVIVGDALQEQFPELADVWSGRMAYTVYLHVGLPRSWILQYSLPRSADAAAAGAVARLDAPWPYSIVRPNLAAASVDADALMVHGFVDQSGHFQSLSLVFPQAFPQAQFLLKSLQQWQFRPASQNGRFAEVEVLLIIPEDLD